MEPTISAELLKEKGYREYGVGAAEFGHRLFQKKVVDDLGIKFFITCEFSFFSNNGRQLRFWDFSAQFKTPKGDVEVSTVQWFNQDGLYSHNSIEDVEQYLEKMWAANDSPYYEKY
jgi:hypothetical protein